MKPVLIGAWTAAAALSLTACAADTTNYPSLARRPAERAAQQPAAAPTASAPAPVDPGLPARLAALVQQARSAHARFSERRGRAESVIAAGSGAAMGSEGWAVASIALADLETARSEALIPLADLDALLAAKLILPGNAGSSDGAAIAAARLEVSGMVAEEDRVLAGLRGRLGG